MIRFILPLMILAIHSCATAASGQANQAYLLRSDIVYASPDGQDLHADVYIPRGDGQRPGVLILHSGSWQRGSKKRMKAVAEQLARHGFVVVNANYRLAPSSKYPAQREDVRAAVAWMRANAGDLRLNARRIGLLGYSAGGHLALMTAFTQGSPNDPVYVQAVVAAGAPTDLSLLFDVGTLQRFIGKSRAEAPDLYRQASPIEYASAASPPVLLIHGQYDLIVSPDHSVKLLEKLRSLGAHVEMHWLPHGHVRTTTGYNEAEVTAAAEFLERQLGLSALPRVSTR